MKKLLPLVFLLLFLTACTEAEITGLLVETKELEETEFTTAYVTRVIDGDTIVIDSGEKVRLTCVNTPEKGEKLYKEATEFTKSLVLNKTITLEKDKTDKDKYGRLLRYVYINNQSVNALLVQEGYAVVYPIKPNLKHCKEYEVLVE